jgi:cobalt/nickel transport system permease protein
MTLAFSPPPCLDSPLRRLDPRWKLAALALQTVSVLLLQSLQAVGLMLALALVLALIGRLPGRWFWARLGWTALLLALFVVPLPFLVADDHLLWQWGWLHLGSRGLVLALVLAGKVLTVTILALVLLTSAPLDANLKAAHALRVPGLLIQLALLSYRYIGLLTEELQRLRIALRVRGFRQRANRHTYRTVGQVAGVLLVRSHERAERVAQAMRCRGFDGRFRSLTDFRTAPADVLVFLLLLAALGVCWAVDRGWA